MSLDILKKRIKDNELSGVFLFCGVEEYTKDYYATQIRKKVDSSPLPEFNHIYFNASTDKISDLEDAVYSLPYMWDVKLIEITDLESAKITESDIEDYARIFSDIPEYLIILAVLRADDQEDEKKSKSNKSDEDESKVKKGIIAFKNTVSDHGLVVEFEAEKADKLVSWINRHLNSKGVKFDINVPREMINVCGNDMYILQGEILKLVEVYDNKPLTVEDVKKYCCANSAYKYFDIVTALNRRDMVSAGRILESLDLDRDAISGAIGLLAKNYSEMLLVKTGIDSGKNYDRISKDIKRPSWLIGKIAASASSVDARFLLYAITQLSNADQKLKSYRGNPHNILEMAFYRICTYGRKT